MGDRRRAASFVGEAATERVVGVLVEEFHRHFASEPPVTGTIDFTHAASAERGENFVRTKLSAGSNGHGAS